MRELNVTQTLTLFSHELYHMTLKLVPYQHSHVLRNETRDWKYLLRGTYYFKAKGKTPYPSPHSTQYFITLLLHTYISPILLTKEPENKLNT